MPRKQKKYHYIYKTTCQITGKFYVGMHSTNNMDDGYLGSGKVLGYSRTKYGDENHIKEVLEYLPSRKALKLREKEIVNEELLAHSLNINLKCGGEGGWDHLNNDSSVQSKKGKKGNAALKILRETSPDWVASNYKIRSLALTKSYNGGTRISSGWSKSASEAARSAEAIAKRKITYSKIGHQAGQKNSQYGSCWVHNETRSMKIKKEDLGKYLISGYSKGRKMFLKI